MLVDGPKSVKSPKSSSREELLGGAVTNDDDGNNGDGEVKESGGTGNGLDK